MAHELREALGPLPDPMANFERGERAAWLSFAVWTVACAWPAWTVDDWWHYAFASVYALAAWAWASPRWSPGIAGCAGACIATLAMRHGTEDHGLAAAVLGVAVSAVASSLLLVVAVRHDVDDRGTLPARLAARQLVLACTLAGWWSPVIIDAIAWLTRA